MYRGESQIFHIWSGREADDQNLVLKLSWAWEPLLCQKLTLLMLRLAGECPNRQTLYFDILTIIVMIAEGQLNLSLHMYNRNKNFIKQYSSSLL